VTIRFTAEEAGILSDLGLAGEDATETIRRVLAERRAQQEPMYRVRYRFPVGTFDPTGETRTSNKMTATRALDLCRRYTAAGMWAEAVLVEDTSGPPRLPEGSTRAKAHYDPDVDVEDE
jgi:hypothetical protein